MSEQELRLKSLEDWADALTVDMNEKFLATAAAFEVLADKIDELAARIALQEGDSR